MIPQNSTPTFFGKLSLEQQISSLETTFTNIYQRCATFFNPRFIQSVPKENSSSVRALTTQIRGLENAMRISTRSLNSLDDSSQRKAEFKARLQTLKEKIQTLCHTIDNKFELACLISSLEPIINALDKLAKSLSPQIKPTDALKQKIRNFKIHCKTFTSQIPHLSRNTSSQSARFVEFNINVKKATHCFNQVVEELSSSKPINPGLLHSVTTLKRATNTIVALVTERGDELKDILAPLMVLNKTVNDGVESLLEQPLSTIQMRK